jgi:hypothetical protein
MRETKNACLRGIAAQRAASERYVIVVDSDAKISSTFPIIVKKKIRVRNDARVTALKFLLQKFSWSDFGTAGSCSCIIIFFLTSFFINSIHQLVATKQRCRFSMTNGRENRTNGNQEKGEKEKEALRKQY